MTLRNITSRDNGKVLDAMIRSTIGGEFEPCRIIVVQTQRGYTQVQFTAGRFIGSGGRFHRDDLQAVNA